MATPHTPLPPRFLTRVYIHSSFILDPEEHFIHPQKLRLGLVATQSDFQSSTGLRLSIARLFHHGVSLERHTSPIAFLIFERRLRANFGP